MIVLSLLVLYASLPPLVIALTSGFQADVVAAGFALFIFQAASCVVLFKIKKRRPAVFFIILFFTILAVAAFFAGKHISWSFFRMFCNLYPGPMLAIIFIFLYKISRPVDFRKLTIGLNRIIILLISYSSLLVMLKLHQLISGSARPAVQDVFFGFYESLNYLPAIFFLRVLRNNAQVSILIENERVWCRNEEITGLFSKTELHIFSYFVKKNRRLRCREIVPFLNKQMPQKDYDCTPERCKASICPAYAVIYRHIKSLDKKLDNLGIGMIVTPENKRDIVDEGWLFIPGKEVRIDSRRSSFNISSAAEVSGKSGRRAASFAGVSAIVSAGAAFLFWEVMSSQAMSETSVLFLLMKILCVIVLGFLLLFPRIEEKRDLASFKENAPNLLFWLIWFYSVVLSIYFEPVFPVAENIYSNADGSLPTYIFNRLLLLLLFSVSVGFFSLSRKPLEVNDEEMLFNSKTLPLGIGSDNVRILRELILKAGGPLHCNEILKLISPEEASECSTDCKPSVCAKYQKIYKRIQSIRKYLQTAGIGTIVSPERKADSHKEGWRLVLNEDVYLKNK